MRKATITYLSLLALLIGLMIFGLGFSTAKFRLPGYQALSLLALNLNSLSVYLEVRNAERSGNLISIQKGQLDDTDNKIRSNRDTDTLISYFNGKNYQAALFDYKGDLVHEWHIPFKKAGLIKPWYLYGLSKRNQMIHGLHLYPNGDLLMLIDFKMLIKVDKDSRFLWANKEKDNHALTVDEQGNIWTLSRRFEYDNDSAKAFQQGYFHDDLILELDASGKHKNSWSLTDLLLKNGYQGLLLSAHNGQEFWNSDPLHANDINILSATQAQAFPGAKKGDLLISMRLISTLIVVSLEDEKIVWSMTGPFLRQHDPEVDNNGILWVFDNRNAWAQEHVGAKYMPQGQAFGGSRIVAFNPATREMVWNSEKNQTYTLFSSIMGRIQNLENGDLLVVEPEGGRVFELNPETNKIVWQFVNFIDDTDVGRVSDADQYPAEELTFLNEAR